MRSQKEILEKINELTPFVTSKKSLFFQQYRILVHKLQWKYAIQFLCLEDQKEETRINWNKTNHLEKSYIKKELAEQLDISAMCVQSRDEIGTMGCYFICVTLIWLLGPKWDKLQKELWELFERATTKYFYFEPIFNKICQEIGYDWDRMKMRYPEKKIEISDEIIFDKGENYGISNSEDPKKDNL